KPCPGKGLRARNSLLSRKNILLSRKSSLFDTFKLPVFRTLPAVGDGLRATSAVHRRRSGAPPAPPLSLRIWRCPPAEETSIARREKSWRKSDFVLHMFFVRKAASS